VIHEAGFDDTFYYFGNERQVRDWPIVREFFFVQCLSCCGTADFATLRACFGSPLSSPFSAGDPGSHLWNVADPRVCGKENDPSSPPFLSRPCPPSPVFPYREASGADPLNPAIGGDL